ncbi:MAG: hypothetical protein K9M11_04545 [Candidatus Pacebacteria bacterium]|nr:hypothetical protein [Candidatus Paceibacterota bacterium]
MLLSKKLSDSIVGISEKYIDRKFDWSSFNCVHFVIEVYAQLNILLPVIERYSFPPREFHLSEKEFLTMPIGHSVFFKRKAKNSPRLWSHVGIVYSDDTIIHCTRHLGNGVVVTPRSILMETYTLAPQMEL